MSTNKFKRRANLILGVVGTSFAALAGIKYYYPQLTGVKLAYMVAEAALVGGIADWFAVTALFKRPLGFPWHTALVPRSRDKITAAIAGTVETELFSKDLLKKKLDGVRLIDFAIDWLAEPGKKDALKEELKHYVVGFLYKLEPQTVARQGQYFMRNYLKSVSLAPDLARALQWAIKEGKVAVVLDYFIKEVQALVSRPSTRQKILEYLEGYKKSKRKTWWQKLIFDTAEWTNTLNLTEAASVLHYELEEFVVDLADPKHPLRRLIDTSLSELAKSLECDPRWSEGVSAWQRGVISRIELTDTFVSFFNYFFTENIHLMVADWVVTEVSQIWDGMTNDNKKREWLEQRLKIALLQLIDLEHNLVAMVVTDAMARMSDNDLNNFIEDKVGEDLAWIRINGSVVGGAVGLILYIFLHYIYEPYIVNFVQF
ncbi:MAG: hypothetical protein H6Q74_1315 [Firmicutes bacterium]|nr:hypothetical protein [Bacillota bacterium]